MNIRLNEDYNIAAIDGSTNFIQGNSSFDKIQVVIPKSKVVSDNCLPSFSFTLPNNRVVGDFVHSNTKDDSNNYIFEFEVPEYILKHLGSLLVTITINFYNDENIIIKKKQVSFQTSVLKGTLVNNDIYVLGDDSTIISMKNNFTELNKRVTENYLELELINQDIDSIDSAIEVINQDIDSIDNAIIEINNELDTFQTKMEPITTLEIEAL